MGLILFFCNYLGTASRLVQFFAKATIYDRKKLNKFPEE